ncbi:MAG: hypothetical protein ACRENP_05420 [Longimicrobiales bacterium]
MSKMRFAYELVSLSALVVSLGVAYVGIRRTADARELVDSMRLSSARAQAQDRLIGSTLKLARVDAVRQARTNGSRRMLMWIVNLDKCSGCFDAVGEWTRLEQLSDHDAFLLLIGQRTPEVEARLRALDKTHVTSLSADAAAQIFGPLLANTKLLVDPDGIVLLADSRAGGQECGWSFEAQVGAVMGATAGNSIRGVAPGVNPPEPRGRAE